VRTRCTAIGAIAQSVIISYLQTSLRRMRTESLVAFLAPLRETVFYRQRQKAQKCL